MISNSEDSMILTEASCPNSMYRAFSVLCFTILNEGLTSTSPLSPLCGKRGERSGKGLWVVNCHLAQRTAVLPEFLIPKKIRCVEVDRERPRSRRTRASGMFALFSPQRLAASCDIITQRIYVAIQNICCKCSKANSGPV